MKKKILEFSNCLEKQSLIKKRREGYIMSLAIDKKLLSTKAIAFVALMGALGSIAAAISLYFVIGPGVALDFAHLGTFIVAIGAGPILGAIVGAIVGIIPAFYFANVALIPGKLLTGFTVGFLYFYFKKFEFFKKNRTRQTLAILIAGTVGFIPEMIFTIVDMRLIGLGPLLPMVIPKAWAEIIILTVFMVILFNYKVIVNSINDLIGEKTEIGKFEYLIFGLVILGTFIFTFIISLITQFTITFASIELITLLLIVCLIGFGVILAVIIFLYMRREKPSTSNQLNT